MFALVDVLLLCEWCFLLLLHSFLDLFVQLFSPIFLSYLLLTHIHICYLFTISLYSIFYTICTLYSLCVSEFQIRIPSIVSILLLCALYNHVIMESWKMFYVNYHAKSKCFAIVIIFWLFRREKRIEIRHSCDGDYTNNTKCHPSCQLRRDQKLNEATNYTEHWTSVHLFVFCYKIKLNKHFVFHICYALCLMSDDIYVFGHTS